MSFDKKLYDKINRVERIEKVLKKDMRQNNKYLEQEGEGYMIPEDGEKTLKISQDYLKENLPKFNKDNIFDLELNYGPYYIDYSFNGSYLLIAGERGHVSIFNWREKDLICEFNVNEKIRNAKFLQNETMIAVAQKSKLFIYDKQGIELHSLDYQPRPKFLEFLPYHFLLVSALKNNVIKYQDVSVGKIITEIKTKNGDISSFTQNTNNAIIMSGHSNGCVCLWTPNMTDPVVKILTHAAAVSSVSIDHQGNSFVSTGLDGKMRVWDLRNYKQVYEYFNPLPASASAISQKGLLAVSHGSVVEIWKDYNTSKQKEPYMKHHFKNNKTATKSMKFVVFEDFLGVGHSNGFSSILVPGAGEANFDTFENNPFQTVKQRQAMEVKMLLEKIPPEMINLDPSQINRVDHRSKAVLDKERIEEERQKANDIMKNHKKKNKMKVRNKETKELIQKEFERNEKVKNKVRAIVEMNSMKKKKEKETLGQDLKVIKGLSDDFNPEIYVDDHTDDNESD